MTFKKWLITLIVLLLVADIAILLDIPVLRQALGFLCFSIIPGLLILYTLKLNEIGFLQRFLLSVGLSISFLIFAGLLVNFLLPWLGNPRPLSTLSLVISLSVIIAILCFGAYWRNRKGSQFAFPTKLGEDFRDKHVSWLLWPVLFPFLAIIGRRILDAGGSNAVLLVMFFLIPLYMVVLMWQSKNVPKLTYPLAIGMISLSLLLARGLISSYLIGGDIYAEYHSFQVISKNLRWAIEAEGGIRGMMSGTLSVSLLPAMLQSILGINPLYIYKAVLLIFISLVPVIGYAIYEKYLPPPYGFLSAFFLMAQLPFIYLLTGQIRLGIALLSFSLAVMVLFDDRIVGLNRSLLYLLFLFSLVVQYYALPLIFLVLMFILWLVPSTWKSNFASQTVSIIAAVLLPATAIYFWWGQVTATVFGTYIYFAKEIVSHLANFFAEEARGGLIASLYTPATQLTLVEQVPGIVQRLSLVTVVIGVSSILVRKEQRAKLGNYV